MQLQNVSVNPKCSSQTTFQTAYPVYHWHKPGGKYQLANEMSDIKTYHSKLANILNSKTTTAGRVKKTEFVKAVLDYISAFDKDYKDFPFVRMYFNYHGKIREAWNGCVYGVEPWAYLITGKDAEDFDRQYRHPIRNAVKISKQYDNAALSEFEIGQAKMSYGYGGFAFVKSLSEKFKDSFGRKIELHTIFKGARPRSSKLIKLEFFPMNDNTNPLITNGVIHGPGID